VGRTETSDGRISTAGSWNDLQGQSGYLDSHGLDGGAGLMCGGRGDRTPGRLVEVTEVVHRVEPGRKCEEQQDQDKGQRFNRPCAGPIHCQHSPTFALVVA
jgi:hypothetical protein